MAEYENKIAMISQELERINNNLRLKSEEAVQLDNQLRNSKMEMEKLAHALREQETTNSKKFETEISKTVTAHESKFSSVKREYEDYRRHSERKNMEMESKFVQMQSEIERLNQALRQKVDESSQLERNMASISQELEAIKRNFK